MERRIYQQKDGKLNEADRQLLASLLLKCGYTVKIGKERKDGKNIYTFLSPMRATKSKYGNRKATYQGIEFDSVKEANRYAALLMLQRAGEISELKTQVPFELVPAQFEPDTVGPRGGIRRGACLEKAVNYVADFVYKDKQGQMVVEDTKGFRTADYIIKRKLMLYVHKIRIKEI